jgi:hypothetical protein
MPQSLFSTSDTFVSSLSWQIIDVQKEKCETKEKEERRRFVSHRAHRRLPYSSSSAIGSAGAAARAPPTAQIQSRSAARSERRGVVAPSSSSMQTGLCPRPGSMRHALLSLRVFPYGRAELVVVNCRYISTLDRKNKRGRGFFSPAPAAKTLV